MTVNGFLERIERNSPRRAPNPFNLFPESVDSLSVQIGLLPKL
jgi:hypothetical protein